MPSLTSPTSPLADHLLPRVRVSDARLFELRDAAQDELVQATQADLSSWYFNFDHKVSEPGFENVAARDDKLQAFARGVRGATSKEFYVRARLETTLDDVARGLHCDSTEVQRAVFAHLYEDKFLDGAVLKVVETKTEDDPFGFVGIKWLAYASPAPGILHHRDYVYFSV